MKDKVLTLVIGFLIGAIVATGGFFIYDNLRTNNMSGSDLSTNRNMPMMKNGNFGGHGDMVPPDMQQQDTTNDNANSTSSDASTNPNNNQSKQSKPNEKQGGMKGIFKGEQNNNGNTDTPPTMPEGIKTKTNSNTTT